MEDLLATPAKLLSGEEQPLTDVKKSWFCELDAVACMKIASEYISNAPETGKGEETNPHLACFWKCSLYVVHAF